MASVRWKRKRIEHILCGLCVCVGLCICFLFVIFLLLPFVPQVNFYGYKLPLVKWQVHKGETGPDARVKKVITCLSHKREREKNNQIHGRVFRTTAGEAV